MKKNPSKPKKAAPKKGAIKNMSLVKATGAEERHKELVANIENLLRQHGIEEQLHSLSLRPLQPVCNPPCGDNQQCVRRVDRNTHQVYYVCEPIR
jgi:predicted SprT family Zn-dependent metalloprotease